MWLGFLCADTRGALAAARGVHRPLVPARPRGRGHLAKYSGLAVVQALFYGITPAVMAVIATTVDHQRRPGRRHRADQSRNRDPVHRRRPDHDRNRRAAPLATRPTGAPSVAHERRLWRGGGRVEVDAAVRGAGIGWHFRHLQGQGRVSLARRAFAVRRVAQRVRAVPPVAA
jgi:hypothetical protein